MYEDLDPKELARIKREGRAKRISNIRRRVMLLGATLAAVFSGVVLVRTGINQPADGSTRTTLAQPAPAQPGDDASDGSFSSEGLGSAAVRIVSGMLSDDSGETSSDSSSAPLTTSQS